MFWYDQSSPPAKRDWRPEIHDSDGLAIWAGNGERIWRPLENPPVAKLHSLRAQSPKGFGLLQRDQAFDHYQDDGVFYDRRPSLWVEPKGDWGSGAVCLYEMPTESETMDNIAMFWRGDKPAKAGERRDFAYRLTWTSKDPTADDASRCVDVYDGPGGIPGAPPVAGVRKFVFDFAGPSLSGLTRDSGVTPETDLPKGAIVSAVAYPVAQAGARWRVMLDVRTKDLSQPQFRLFLKRGETALSETVIKALES
jgi:glucans biosynthesis protein